MACCLTTPSHYPNQCWLIISELLWHWPEGNFSIILTTSSPDISFKLMNLRLLAVLSLSAKFDSTKSLGVYYWYVKTLQCGHMEHGLKYIAFYYPNHIGAPACLRLVYQQCAHMPWLNTLRSQQRVDIRHDNMFISFTFKQSFLCVIFSNIGMSLTWERCNDFLQTWKVLPKAHHFNPTLIFLISLLSQIGFIPSTNHSSHTEETYRKWHYH